MQNAHPNPLTAKPISPERKNDYPHLFLKGLMMDHVYEFLRSMGEHEMAEEVANAMNRLEAFSDGLDRTCFDAQVKANETLLAQNASLQARIDELMLEFCPNEMTPEQLAEYERHQVPVSAEEQAFIDALLGADCTPQPPAPSTNQQ